jgi:hypothetical protein
MNGSHFDMAVVQGAGMAMHFEHTVMMFAAYSTEQHVLLRGGWLGVMVEQAQKCASSGKQA